MGRPLYSLTSPAVREPEQPICETWSYLHPFDPDSDEFFASENVVYEDFIDSVTHVEEDERDMLLLGSPVTSESSLSDDEGPLAPMDAFQDMRSTADDTAPEPAALRVRLASRVQNAPVRALAARAAMRAAPPPRFTYSVHGTSIPVPTPSAPIPVPAVSRRIDERAFPSPSTPSRQTPMTYVSMSPPPTSTPRLYTWARNPSHSASPSSGSPFANPHARTSYAHLSPTLIRIRDVTV